MYKTFHGEIHQGKHVDQVLREFFSDYNYKGIFLDIGAFEPIRISNSHHFYKNGWDIRAIEANPGNVTLLKNTEITFIM